MNCSLNSPGRSAPGRSARPTTATMSTCSLPCECTRSEGAYEVSRVLKRNRTAAAASPMCAESSDRPGRSSRPGRLGRLSVARVSIETKRIGLAAFLKWAQVVGTGGQAKMLIQSRRVKVNGQVELRRGRTPVPGDRVGVGARGLEVVGSEDVPDAVAAPGTSGTMPGPLFTRGGG